VVNAALAQFDQPNVRLIRKNGVRSVTAARKIVRELAGIRAVVCHSLVSPAVRDAVREEARRRMISTVDILGPVLAVLSDHLGIAPHRKPGRAYRLQKEYFDRIDAVSFTLEHDDGAGLATLSDADVVLVGVSRVSKSVTCFYLAYHGVRAANVPLIPGLPPPAQLLALPREKVIGLTVTPHRLHSVREVRRRRFGTGVADGYVDQREISAELRHALRLMKRHSWPTIDVSYMAVEEVAVQVLQLIGK
jgi:regulator of PEP synthase PpsR (kinase-PPPase family)